MITSDTQPKAVTSRDMALSKGITPPIPLKECPFCGDVAVLTPIKILSESGYVVSCCNCHARALFKLTGYSGSVYGIPKIYHTDEMAQREACEVWNRRKEEALDNEQATA